MNYKKFKDFGLSFEFHHDPNCISCSEGNCHNNVTSKKDGKEYNVHISTDVGYNEFRIQVSENSSTDSIIDETFTKEEEAVKFLCDNFEEFTCF